MWQSLYDPPFVLPPKHAAVFRRAARGLSFLAHQFQGPNEWPDTDIVVFDELTAGQKQVAILTVARALLDANSEAPDVTAVLAGTVDAIYVHLQTLVESEIGYRSTTRRMILEALDEMNYWESINEGLPADEEPEVRPSPKSRKVSRWADYVEDLRTEILDDYDHDLQGDLMDLPPDEAAAIKKQLNIDPDYFIATVEDPAPEQLAQVLAEIKALLASDDNAG